MRTFEEVFGREAEVVARAPGRVNLLGEHTDYNDGFVLPAAIPQQTTVAVARSQDGEHHFYAGALGERSDVSPQARLVEGFARYPFGCLKVLEEEGWTVPPLCLHIASEVPMGAGLSSSAALEVATLRAVRKLLELPLDDVRLGLLGQRAEVSYAGVSCGIMDQLASSLAGEDRMLFLDTRTLEQALVPFPAGTEVLVLDSGVPRTLAGSGYNTRRAECEEAARRLGVKALRDVLEVAQVEGLAEPWRRRARHVVSENLRVLEARGGVSAERFGALMNASHASLRDDYAVSVPALDLLVSLLQGTPGVLGARLTGAGFGGACVALVSKGAAVEIGEAVLARYEAAGQRGRMTVPRG